MWLPLMLTTLQMIQTLSPSPGQPQQPSKAKLSQRCPKQKGQLLGRWAATLHHHVADSLALTSLALLLWATQQQHLHLHRTTHTVVTLWQLILLPQVNKTATAMPSRAAWRVSHAI